MSKKINLLFILGLFFYSSYAQVYPKGAYFTMEEVISKQPSMEVNLTIEKRTIGEIKMSGGNDYRLVSNDKSISKKDIKKKMLAYSSGDKLYINCLKYKVQSWYAPILNTGRYLLFVGGTSQEENLFNYQVQESKISTDWVFFGAIGGAIQGAKLAQLRFPYLIDSQNDELILLDDFALEKILANHNAEILSQYRTEKTEAKGRKKKREDLILKFLNIVNQAGSK